MIILARLSITAAVLCTMWLNGSYAWNKAAEFHDRLAFVAIALTIDLAKCSLLGVAATLRVNSFRLAALLAVILWLPCFACSTFWGYSMITTTRATTSAGTEGLAQQRARAQTAYDDAARDLATAKASPFWPQSASCTAPKQRQKEFCAGVARLRTVQQQAAQTLTSLAPVEANPEQSVLAKTFGIDTAHVVLAIALVPAILLELLASVGSYAVSRSIGPTAPQKPARGFLRSSLARWRQRIKNRLGPTAGGLAALPSKGQPVNSPAAPQPTLTWELPSS